ncbi:dimethylarginine dimethylaminohydrolase family protein [Alkalicoccus halolimnae]|uniref:Arginine deiminase family protein n=1 Tax=Alkalicoccus halolimnae TaxID=1667239 RepID=A0A5C7FAK3_9BACI|nr:arginine deiminase family protein [Alkalicoccus halolimnae]TXF83250.1 N(G),N(G)-dimethylarginine dimethylaminohydrolase [Alkalicoccus halolimnae]
MKVQQIIVKKPAASFAQGLTTANLGTPDYSKVLEQHRAYVEVMEEAGVMVHQLASDNDYPDDVFVEDPAVVTSKFALITRPGADSRRGETEAVEAALKDYHRRMYTISEPGTLEGGDVLHVEDHFYIGLSTRTNKSGAEQFEAILQKEGYGATIIPLKEFFHLKTGIAYLGDNTVLTAGEFIDHDVFKKYKQITVSQEEEYAANCIRVNEVVIVPEGFPETKRKIEEAGFMTREAAVSEFRKQDGGLSCLSLRF